MSPFFLRKKIGNNNRARKTIEKNFIKIPFPDDKTDQKDSEIDLIQIKSIQPTETEKSNTLINKDLPLEKLFVYPETEITNPTKTETNKSESTILEKLKESVVTTGNQNIISEEIKRDSKVIQEEPKPTKDVGKALTDNKKRTSLLPKKMYLKI